MCEGVRGGTEPLNTSNSQKILSQIYSIATIHKRLYTDNFVCKGVGYTIFM